MTVDEGPPIEQAVVGAGIGFIGGAVLGSELANRCRPVTNTRCTGARRVKYIVAYGLLGAVVGGAAGAIAGGQR